MQVTSADVVNNHDNNRPRSELKTSKKWFVVAVVVLLLSCFVLLCFLSFRRGEGGGG